MTTPYVDLNTIHTPTSGTTPTVSWGSDIRSNFQTIANPPGCIVTRTTALAVTSGTATAVPFTSTDLRDTDAYHDTSTNPTRCTVPTGLGGLYIFTAQIGYAANGSGQRSATIVKNGTTNIANTNLGTIGNAGVESAGYLVGYAVLVAGDYIELSLFQNSGGNLNTSTAEPPILALIWQGAS